MFDPYAPFIASDGLEYEDFAAFIQGCPVDCWRNKAIQNFRSKGHSEETIRIWIKAYDGDDATPSHTLPEDQGRLNLALDKLYKV